MPASSTTSFPKSSISSTIKKNFHSLAGWITLIVDGATHNLQYFFIRWQLMITSVPRTLREFLFYPLVLCLMNSFRQILYEIEHGMLKISESEWPAFLYPRGTNPDVEDDQAGLFRGYLLPRVCFILIYVQRLISIQVFRQIFTSPSSALNPETAKKGRPCKARLHNLTSITGRTIAYTCVMVRIFSLSILSHADSSSFEPT